MTTVCHIPPAGMTDLIPDDYPAHLCVADVVVRHREYREFYQRAVAAGQLVILDNAAFEGHVTDYDTLVTAARALKPTEVVLSDDPRSAIRTRELSKRCAIHLRAGGYRGDFMVCPHGVTVDEYVRNASDLVEIDGVTTVGIVEEIPELFGMPREEMVGLIHEMFPSVSIHLLGVTEGLTELLDETMREIVRTVDTAKFVVWGLNKFLVTPNHIPAYPGRDSLGGRMGYFDYTTDDVFRHDAVIVNIEGWKEYLTCVASSEAS